MRCLQRGVLHFGSYFPASPRSTIQTVTKSLYLYNNVIMYAITVVAHLKTKHPVYIPVVNLWKHLKFMPFAIRDKLIHSDFPPKGHGNVLFQLFFNVVLFCLGPQCLKNQDASRCRCGSLAPTSIFQGNNWGVCLYYGNSTYVGAFCDVFRKAKYENIKNKTKTAARAETRERKWFSVLRKYRFQILRAKLCAVQSAFSGCTRKWEKMLSDGNLPS